MGSRIEISGHPSEHPVQNCATVLLLFQHICESADIKKVVGEFFGICSGFWRICSGIHLAKWIILGMIGVAVGRYGLRLWENDATGSTKVF